MRVGIPTEIKNNEYRVAITPAGVAELTRRGHEVLVQAGAGDGSAIADSDFKAAGAQSDRHRRRGVGRSRSAAQGQGADRGRVRPDARGPDALHLPAPGRVAVVHRCADGVGHHVDRLRDRADRRRRVAPARADERGRGSAVRSGRRLPPDAHPRWPRRPDGRRARRRSRPTSSSSAAEWPATTPPPSPKGMGARVTVSTSTSTRCARSTPSSAAASRPATRRALELEEAVKQADLVIGAVLVPGAKAPKLVTNSPVAQHEVGRGAGGHRDRPGRLLRRLAAHHPRRSRRSPCTTRCSTAWRTCRPRCRATSTFALTNATMPYVIKLADKGWQAACRSNPALAKGLSTHEGALLSEQVAADLALPFTDPAALLA